MLGKYRLNWLGPHQLQRADLFLNLQLCLFLIPRTSRVARLGTGEINLVRLGIVPTAINLTLGTWRQGRSEKIAIYPNVTYRSQWSQATSGERRHAVDWMGISLFTPGSGQAWLHRAGWEDCDCGGGGGLLITDQPTRWRVPCSPMVSHGVPLVL